MATKGCFIWLNLDDNQNQSNAPGVTYSTLPFGRDRPREVPYTVFCAHGAPASGLGYQWSSSHQASRSPVASFLGMLVADSFLTVPLSLWLSRGKTIAFLENLFDLESDSWTLIELHAFLRVLCLLFKDLPACVMPTIRGLCYLPIYLPIPTTTSLLH